MVSVRQVLDQKVRAGRHKLSYLSCQEADSPGEPAERVAARVPTRPRAPPGVRKGPHQGTQKSQVHFRLLSK